MIGYPSPVRQLLILLFLAAPAAARKSSVTPEMDKLLMAGVDDIYMMRFPQAEADMAQAIALDPTYPHPYFGRAAIDLVDFIYGEKQGDPALLRSFEVKALESIKAAEAYLKTHPNDPDALFILGASHGMFGRLAIVQRRWLQAFGHGRDSMKFVRRAVKLEPELYDAVLGLGMFDYYVATIPKFAGWLAKIVLGGDRARGLKQIRLAAEKGRYAKVTAQMILVEIYLEDPFGAYDPKEALRLMREVHSHYPGSAMLDTAYISALYESKELGDAIREAREYQKRVKSGRYPATNLAGSHALLGTLLWASGEKDAALAEFVAGAEARSVRTKWMVWNRVRVGQVLDALGRREEALAAYKTAYAEPDEWGYRALIKPCLAAPCVGEKYPGRFSP
jgi:tetratricopeptide (TPR) repeat protein